ncbi:hypothetical protein CKF54_01220 [Psittacicella hinzii]|uniref:Filamentous haemagglutinin FhaB/tRNA nuclease CdiA-like TPS domain-containing protein n=1 Tax=Psittacicella hinzii TaxID=2028575 RepID=A0A3A1YAI3_9GAMM|nr:ESPR-type extended signal peptide-containing protein [Psittacicella hinzii]RIY34239.1 hypothetical protein CKF54_01220 [Psittacicella hinzii]
MNKIYKLKFNRKTKTLMAVSELATNAITGQSSDSTESQTTSTNRLAKFFRNSSILATSSLLSLGALIVPSKVSAELSRQGMQVVHGNVQQLTQGLVTTYQTAPNTIIDWQKFNIRSEEIVRFVQESTNSAVLNRVLGGQASQILGQLQSNGQVFIVNPAGIVFGQNSVVDVASLVASTLDITNEDFLNGNYVFNQDKDQAIASILTQGVIKVQNDGTIALVGGQVSNTGVLEAKNGTVYLLAGQSIVIQDLENPLISYKVTANNKAVNLGSIVAKKAYLLANKVANGITSTVGNTFADLVASPTNADKAVIDANGEIQLFGATESEQVQTNRQVDTEVVGIRNSLVINNGTLNSSSKTAKGGTVSLLGDVIGIEENSYIEATGTTGGVVYVGGDAKGRGIQHKLAEQSLILAGSTINVSGESDAGQVYTWGNQSHVEGTFVARSINGYGGFVETSGKYINVVPGAFYVDATSLRGDEYLGTWLLDPVDFIITHGNVNTERWNEVSHLLGELYEVQDTTSVTRYNLTKTSWTSFAMTDGTVNYLLACGTASHASFYTDGNITVLGSARINHSDNNNFRRVVSLYAGKDINIWAGAEISVGYLNLTVDSGNISINNATLFGGYGVDIHSLRTGNITIFNGTSVTSNRNITVNLGNDTDSANRYIKINNATLNMTGSLTNSEGINITFHSNYNSSIQIENSSKIYANSSSLSIGITGWSTESSSGQFINLNDSEVSSKYTYLWAFGDIYANNSTIYAVNSGNIFSREGSVKSGTGGFKVIGNETDIIGYYGIDVQNVTTQITNNQQFISNNSQVSIANSTLAGCTTGSETDVLRIFGLDTVSLFNTTANAASTSVYSVAGGLNLTDSTVKAYSSTLQTPVYLGQLSASSLTTEVQAYSAYDADSVINNTTVESSNGVLINFQAPNSTQRVTINKLKLDAQDVAIQTIPDTNYSASSAITIDELSGTVKGNLFLGIDQTTTNQQQQATQFILNNTTSALTINGNLNVTVNTTANAQFNLSNSEVKFGSTSSKANLHVTNTAGGINVENVTFNFVDGGTTSELNINATNEESSAVTLRAKDLTVNNAKSVRFINGTQQSSGAITINQNGNLAYSTNDTSNFEQATVNANYITAESRDKGLVSVNASTLTGNSVLILRGNNLSVTNGSVVTTGASSGKSPSITLTNTATFENSTVVGYADVTASAKTLNATNTKFNASNGEANYSLSATDLNFDNVSFTANTDKTLVKLCATNSINLNNSNISTNRYDICATNNVTLDNTTLEAYNTTVASVLDTATTTGTLAITNNSTLILHTASAVNATGSLVISNSTVDLTKVSSTSNNKNATLQSLNGNATFANFTLKRNNQDSSTVTLKAKENLSITQGTIVEGYSVTLESENSSIHIKDSNISAFYTNSDGKSGGYPNITANKDINIDNSNITGWQKLVFTANTGNVTFTDSTITTNDTQSSGLYSGDLEVVAKSNTAGGGNVTLANTKVNSDPEKSNISLVAATGISTLQDTVLAGRKVNLTAQAGSIDLQSSTINSTGTDKDSLVLSATEKLIVNASTVIAKQDINLSSVAGTINDLEVTNGSVLQSINGNVTVDLTTATSYQFNASSLIATNGTASLVTKGDLVTQNSTFRGKEVNLTSTAGSVSLTNSVVEAVGESSSPVIKTAKDLTLDNTTVTATGNINLNTDAGNLTIVNASKVTSTQGGVTVCSTCSTASFVVSNATLKAEKDVTLNQSGTSMPTTTLDRVKLISDNGNVVVNSSATKLILSQSELSALNGTASYHVNGDLTVDNSAIRVKQDLVFDSNTVTGQLMIVNGSVLQSNAGKVDVTISGTDEFANSSIIAATDANLTKESGDLVITSADTLIQGHNINVKAKDGNVTLSQTQLQGVANDSGAYGDLSIQATNASMTVANLNLANVSIKQFANVSLAGATGVNLANSTVSGANSGEFSVNAGLGGADIYNATVQGFKNATVVAAKDVNINHSNFTGTEEGDFKATSTAGSVSLTNSVVSKVENATLDGDQGVVVSKVVATGTEKGYFNATSNNGSISLTDTQVTKFKGFQAQGKTQVTLENLTASGTGTGNGDFVVNSTAGQTSIGNSTLTEFNNFTFAGDQGVTVTNVTTAATWIYQGDLTISSNNGSATITNTKATQFSNLNVSAKADITAQNLTTSGIYNGNARFASSAGQTNLSNTSVSSFNNLEISGDQGVTVTNTTATGTFSGNFTLSSNNGAATVTNSTVAEFSNFTATAKTNLTAYNLTATGAYQGDFSLTSETGNTSLTQSSVSRFRGLNVAGDQVVTFANVAAAGMYDGDVTIESNNGAATISNSTVSEFIYFNVTAKEDAKVQNLTVKGIGSQDFNLVSSAGNASVTDSLIKDFSNVTLTSELDMTFTNVTATGTNKGDLTLTSNNGSATLADLEVTRFNNLNVSAKADASAQSINFTGAGLGDFNLLSAEGNASLTNSTFDVIVNLTVEGNQEVSATNVTAVGGAYSHPSDLKVRSHNGTATLANATVTSFNNLSVTAKDDVTVANLTASGNEEGDFTLNSSTGSASLTNATVSNFNNLTLNGEQGIGVTNVTATSTTRGDFTANSNNGSATFTNSTVTEVNNFNVTAKADINVQNLTATGTDEGYFNLVSSSGSTSVTQATVTRFKGLKLDGEQEVAVTNLTAAGSGGGDLTVNSNNGTVTLTNSTVTEVNNVNLTAKADVTVQNVTATGTDKGDFSVESTNGTATLVDSTVTRFNNASVTAAQDVTVENVTATGTGNSDFTVESTNGTASLVNSTVTQFNNASVTAEQDVTVENVTATGTGNGDFTVESTNGTASLANSTVTQFNNASVTAEQDVTVENVTATGTNNGDFTVESTNGTASLANSTVTQFNNVTVSAEQDVTVENVTATGTDNGDFTVESTNGTASLTNLTVTQFNNASVTAEQDVTVENVTATGTNNGDFTVESTNGTASLANSTVTQFNNASVTAEQDVTIENVTATGTGNGDFMVESTNGTATIANSTVTQFNNATVAGDQGVTLENVTATGTGSGDFTVTSENGSASLTNATVTEFNNFNVTAQGDVTAQNLTATGTDKGDFNLVSSTGNATLTEANITKFNNLKVKAEQDVTVTNVTTTGTGTGDFDLESTQGKATLVNSSVSQYHNLTVNGNLGVTIDKLTAVGTNEGNFTVTSANGGSTLENSTVTQFKNLTVQAKEDSLISNLTTYGTGEGSFRNTSSNGSATVKDSVVENYVNFTNEAKKDATLTNLTTNGTGTGDFNNNSTNGKAVIGNSTITNYNNLTNSGKEEATVTNVTAVGTGNGDFINESSNGTATLQNSTITNFNNLNVSGATGVVIDSINSTGTGNGNLTATSTNGSVVVTNSTITNYQNLILSGEPVEVTNNTVNLSSTILITSESEPIITDNSGQINSSPTNNGKYISYDAIKRNNPNLVIVNPFVADDVTLDPNYADWLETGNDLNQEGDDEKDLAALNQTAYGLHAANRMDVTLAEVLYQQCTVELGNLIDKYEVTEEDRRNLPIGAIVSKYNFTDREAIFLQASCANHVNLLKSKLLESVKPKSTVANKE